MAELFIPTLHTFAMGNTFTGSSGLFRFRVVPQVVKNGKEIDMENSSMEAEYWHGLFCYEKSEMEGSASFPMTEAGRLTMKSWLEEKI